MNHCNDAWFFWSALCWESKVKRWFIFNILFYFKRDYSSFKILSLIPSQCEKLFPKTGLVFLLLVLCKRFCPVLVCWDKMRRDASQHLIVRCAFIVWGGLFFSSQLSTLSLQHWVVYQTLWPSPSLFSGWIVQVKGGPLGMRCRSLLLLLYQMSNSCPHSHPEWINTTFC